MNKVIRSRNLPALALLAILSTTAWAQTPPPPVVTVDQPDAQRTKDQLSSLLDHYPPALKGVLALDPALLANQPYLAPYPALTSFLNAHPEVARNPSFYVGQPYDRRGFAQDRTSAAIEIWRQVLDGTAVFIGFGMAIGLIVWLIRTVIDYRRWNRLASVQAEFHTRILDRFTANDELIAYIQSHAGKRFLESTPIALDAGTRSMAAPLGRILWSVQAGLVLAAAGIGLQLVTSGFSDDAVLPLKVMSALGIALGIGFVVSATISFMISQKLGLIEPRPLRPEPRLEPPTQ